MATVSIEKKRKFRGKFLGEVNVNNADNFIKKHGIAEGTFKDLYVGDWFVSVIKTDYERIIPFRIADIDIYYGTTVNKHHICIIPDAVMLLETIYKWCDDFFNKVAGYKQSDLNTIVMPKINKSMEDVFGKHLLEYSELLTVDAKGSIEPEMVKGILLSEMELCGAQEFTPNEYNGYINKQLTLFAERPEYINPTNTWFWLRDISKCNRACFVNRTPWLSYTLCDEIAKTSEGIRPRFLLG